MTTIVYPKGFHSCRLRIDCGDLVYAILFCRVLHTRNLYVGTNDDVIFYRGLNGFGCLPGKCGRQALDFIYPLVLRQKENFDVIEEYKDQEYSYDFAEFDFNNPPIQGTNLTEWHAHKFNINWLDFDSPWLVADTDDSFKNKILVGKTSRYTVVGNPVYKNILESHKGNCVFVGLEQEFLDFKQQYDLEIEFFNTNDVLKIASAINSCRAFVGNSSLFAAIAIGLGKRTFIELNRINNYLFFNGYTTYFYETGTGYHLR